MGHEKVVGRRGGGCRVCGEHGRLQSLERGARSLKIPRDPLGQPSEAVHLPEKCAAAARGPLPGHPGAPAPPGPSLSIIELPAT